MTLPNKEIEKLMTDLKSDDWMVRESAVDKLGEINEYISIPPLILALSDRDADIREKASEFLKAIASQDFGLDAAKWQEWWQNNKTDLTGKRPDVEKTSQLHGKGGTLIIGNKEKHEISFGIIDVPIIDNPLTASSKLVRKPYLFVDNDEIKINENRKLSFIGDPVTLNFDIGDKEKHNLKIRYVAPSLLGSSIAYFIVKVDDVVVYGDDKVIGNEDKQELISSAIKTLLLWGGINIIVWFILGLADRTNVLARFPEIKFWLWLVLYGGLVIGVLLLFFGIIGLFIRRPIIVLLDGIGLLLVGVFNIGGDFLAIPALKDYGIVISTATIVDAIFKDRNLLWKLLGFLQLWWSLRAFRNFSKIQAGISRNVLPVPNR
jgi:hypothetical protein